jgi:Phage tail baseplate hub (GPD)
MVALPAAATPTATALGHIAYNISVNGTNVTDLVLNVAIEQEWGKHDITEIRIEYNRGSDMSDIQPWADGALVEVQWGLQPQTLTPWYGYVSHHELAGNADSGTHNLQYTYYCIGTSMVMNTMTSKLWGSTTASDIAKQMATKYSLRCVVTTSTATFTDVMQASMSDFQFMNYLAQRTGYQFWVSGGTLYFVDPAVFFVASTSTGVSYYRQDKMVNQQDTMRDFRVLRGNNLPGATVGNRTVYGIDSSTGQVVSSSSNSSNTMQVIDTSRVGTSLAEVQQQQKAWSNLSQMWIGGTAELFGDQTLYPGKLVYLDGNALPGSNIGYWVLSKTKHILIVSYSSSPVMDNFQTQVELVRNAGQKEPNFTGTMTVSPEFVTCTKSGSKWISGNQSVITGTV